VNAPGPQPASPLRRLAGFALDWTLVGLTLSIGWIIWWLIVARGGRSPAKQLIAMRVVRKDGTVAGLGRMLVRDIVVKGAGFIVIAGVIVEVLGDYPAIACTYLAFAVAALWCVWDANRRCLWDKVVCTRVMHGRG